MTGGQQGSEQTGLTSFTTISTWSGGLVWIVYLILHGMSNGLYGGWIERLFLLAPLVVVPLALWVVLKISDRGEVFWFHLVVYGQPIAAVSLVLAFAVQRPGVWFVPAWPHAVIWLTVPWLIVCAMLLIGEGVFAWWGHVRTIMDGMVTVPLLFVQVGGFWLMIDQIGVAFMEITEPIRLLTAVHFHFTGFGTLILLAGIHAVYTGAGHKNRAFLTGLAALGVSGGIPMVAIGFMGSDLIKSTGVILLSASMVFAAVLLFQVGRMLDDPLHAWFVRCGAVSVVAGMVLATVFQVTLHLGRPVLSIPVMTVTHGVLNGIGFMILALIGIRSGLIEETEDL